MTRPSDAWAALWEQARQADMLNVAQRVGARLKHGSVPGDWIGPCPAGCAKLDGFIVTPKKHLFLCRPSGATGDAVDMVVHARGWSKVDALTFITGANAPTKSNGAGPHVDERPPAKRKRDIETIEGVIKRAVPIVGTQAEAYLRERGLTPLKRLTRDLMFVSSLDYWGFALGANNKTLLGAFPAMVGAIRNLAGDVTALHFTYFDAREPVKWTPCNGADPDRRVNPAKKTRGLVSGGMIRMGQIGDKLALGEGIETTLGWYGLGLGAEDIAIASAVSLGNLVGGYVNGEPDLDRPGVILPDDVREVVLLGDSDSDTNAALLAAVRRFRAQGRLVSVHCAPLGMDWADVAKGKPIL